jgi:hypothetical protein
VNQALQGYKEEDGGKSGPKLKPGDARWMFQVKNYYMQLRIAKWKASDPNWWSGFEKLMLRTDEASDSTAHPASS